MPDGALPRPVNTRACVGPNAILQLQDPMERLLGPGALAQVLTRCQVALPSGQEMIPEESVEQVHRTLWQLFPDRAAELSQEAGRGTARYIRQYRIPKLARLALRIMPRGMAEARLASAVSAHAWTFCGSGQLSVTKHGREWHFVVSDNPLADRNARPPHPCCWHCAVFETLFSLLLRRRYHCEETSCCGCGGTCCRFVVCFEEKRNHFKGLEA